MNSETRADSAKKIVPGALAEVLGSVNHIGLWWGALTLGGACVVLGGIVGQPILVSLILPLVILVLYAALGLAIPSKAGTRPQFADTVYYLGFVFTLIALASALFLFGGQEWDDVTRTEIVARFGLALATTILGLAIRVAIVDLMPNEESGVRDAEEALSDAITRFRDRIDLHVEQLNVLSDKHFQAFEGTVTSSAKSLESHTETAGKSLDSAVDRVGQAIESSVDAYSNRFRSKTEAMQLPDELIRNAIAEPLTNIAEQAKQMNQAISDSVQAQKKLATSANNIVKKFSNLEGQLSPLESFAEKSSEITSALTKLVELVDRFAVSAGDVIGGLGAATSEMQGRTKQLGSALDDIVGDIQRVSGTLEQQVSLVSQHQAALAAELAKSRESMIEVHNDLASAAKVIVKHLGQS